MVVRNETLCDLCKQALSSVLDYINELISKGERFAQTIRLKPIIEEDQFRGLKRFVSIDKGEILGIHMSEIENLPQVKKLSDFLDGMVEDKDRGIKVKKNNFRLSQYVILHIRKHEALS